MRWVLWFCSECLCCLHLWAAVRQIHTQTDTQTRSYDQKTRILRFCKSVIPFLCIHYICFTRNVCVFLWRENQRETDYRMEIP